MKQKHTGPRGQVRIISGQWRNTRLAVPDVEGLRPSSDRMRETLFNWLQPVVHGAQVLDLFAGSGALGLEALSRGAVACTFVERDAALSRSLKDTLARLQGGTAGTVQTLDALAWLARAPSNHFDLLFVDPPFAAGLWSSVLAGIDTCAKPDAWLYVESPPDAADAVPPANWEKHRELKTQDARGTLYRRTPSN